MKTILIFVFSLFFSMGMQAQIEAGDVFSGALRFLTTNPKTANRMKPGEKVALNLVGELLKTQANRNHDLRVASQGKDQININYGNGTASIVRDVKGNIYLLLEGTVYPISKEFIEQASQNQTLSRVPSKIYLPGYDEKQMEEEFTKVKLGIFLFSYYHDDNMDGHRNFEEFHGKTRNFEAGKAVNIFVGHFHIKKKNTAISKLEVIDSHGKIVHTNSQKNSGLFGYVTFWFGVQINLPGDYSINVVISDINGNGKTIGTTHLREAVRIF